MRLAPHVLVLADRDGDGVLFDGSLWVDVDADREPLVTACLRALTERGVDARPGDVLFFREAAAGHRYVRVP